MAALAASWHHVFKQQTHSRCGMPWSVHVQPYPNPAGAAVSARGAGQKETRSRGKPRMRVPQGAEGRSCSRRCAVVACLAHSPGRMQGAGVAWKPPCKVRFCRATNCTERICTAPVAAQTRLFAMGRMPDKNTLAEEWVRPHGVSTRRHMCCFGSGTMDRQEMPAEARQGSNAGPFKMCTEAMCPV